MFVRIVSGTLGGRRCSVPPTGVRPTSEKVRAAIFDSLASLLIFSDTTFIDLFSGSGAMAFEAFSREFGEVFALEKDKKTAQHITETMMKICTNTPPNFHLLKGDSTGEILQKVLPTTASRVVFIDPPYHQTDEMVNKLFPLLAEHNIVRGDDIIIIESEKTWHIKNGISPYKIKKYGDTLLTWFTGEQLHEH